MFRSILGAVLIVIVGTGSAQAVLTAYEGFSGVGYTAGANLDALSGGSGTWNSAWRAGAAPAVTMTVGSAGLSYPGLQVSGLSANALNGGGATTIDFRDVGPFSSGEAWISFLAKPQAANSANSGGNFFGLSTYDSSDLGSGAVTAIAKNSTVTKWGLVAFPTSTGGSGPHGTGTQNAGFVNAASPDLVVNQTYLLVAHFHFATGAVEDPADTVSLYIDPVVAASPPGTADVVYTDTMAPVIGQLNFDRIRLGAQAGRDWLIDEIRVGTNFQDVVPMVPNDTDFDGMNGTDINDFHTLRQNYLTGTMFAQGDANHDGIVNHLDFFMWRTAFVAGGGSMAGISFSFAVPEPSTCVSLLIGCLVAVSGRRARRHRGN